MTQQQEYLTFGTELARTAKEMAEAAQRQGLKVSRKPDGTSVTDADIAISEMVIESIKARYPRHAVRGEELSRGSANAAEIWRLDPIDGTGEFIRGPQHGRATYGFGLSKERHGQLEMGLFLGMPRNELFTAVHGMGAYLNGKRIRVNQNIFRAHMPYDYCHWDGARPDLRFFDKLLEHKPIGNYSAISQACDVAAGRSSFAVFPGDTRHDIWPGRIIVQEAGGRVTDVRGNQHPRQGVPHGAVYSNGRVHEDVIRALRAHN
jgi:myo-inositol-1(or 4)-monophosphatase